MGGGERFVRPRRCVPRDNAKTRPKGGEAAGEEEEEEEEDVDFFVCWRISECLSVLFYLSFAVFFGGGLVWFGFDSISFLIGSILVQLV